MGKELYGAIPVDAMALEIARLRRRVEELEARVNTIMGDEEVDLREGSHVAEP